MADPNKNRTIRRSSEQQVLNDNFADSSIQPGDTAWLPMH